MYALGSKQAYARWTIEQDNLSREDHDGIRRYIAGMTRRPLFSILLLAPDEPSSRLYAPALQSIRRQLYPCWEILASPELAPDFSDPRVSFLPGGYPDLIGLYNMALLKAAGQFVIAVPADAILADHALFELADAASSNPELELIFTDEDIIDPTGHRSDPYFKTSWDPDLMLGRDAVGTLAAFRTATVQRLGGLRMAGGATASSLDILQYDLALRFGADVLPSRIHHVPSVLCHRAPVNNRSTIWDSDAARTVVRRHLSEIGESDIIVEPTPLAPVFNRLIRPVPVPAPLATIIVPTRDKSDLLVRCIDGILSRTNYPAIELLIVDNDSQEPQTLALFDEIQRDERVRILKQAGPFNYAALNNAAAKIANGDILVLLNNDTEVIGPDWLAELVSHAIRPEIGAVGAKLLYGDGRVQHCGISLGPGWGLMHSLRLSERGDPGPGAELALVRSVSAVTAACLAIRKSVFFEVGGLDAENFAIAFNDVDLCLRLTDRGYRIICTPVAELFHLESLSRGYDNTVEKQLEARLQAQAFCNIWEPQLDADPYYNANVIFRWDSAEYAAPPRKARQWRTSDLRSHTSFERFYGSAPASQPTFASCKVSLT
jgi:GT2 family glycosyltransferase